MLFYIFTILVMGKINKLLEIFFDKDFDNKTTERKVLEKIDKILQEWPIDNINSRDDFIRYLFRIYYYKSKYRPFVSYVEIIFKYYLIILLIFLIWVPLWWWLFYNENSIFDYKTIWIVLSNIMYLSIPFYIIIRTYSYIRKIIRHEIKKNFLWTFWMWLIKIILFTLLIPFTHFIWNFFASIYNVLHFFIIELFNTLVK